MLEAGQDRTGQDRKGAQRPAHTNVRPLTSLFPLLAPNRPPKMPFLGFFASAEGDSGSSAEIASPITTRRESLISGLDTSAIVPLTAGTVSFTSGTWHGLGAVWHDNA